MEISKKVGDFLKLTDSGEVIYLLISEIIMVSKIKGLHEEDETHITLRNGKVFQVSSTAEKVMLCAFG